MTPRLTPSPHTRTSGRLGTSTRWRAVSAEYCTTKTGANGEVLLPRTCVYINGKLSYSTILENVPFVFQRFLFIGEKQNNFNGYLCNLEYFNDALSSNDILNIYNSQKNKLDNNVDKYSRTYYLRRIKQLEEEKKQKELNEKNKFAF